VIARPAPSPAPRSAASGRHARSLAIAVLVGAASCTIPEGGRAAHELGVEPPKGWNAGEDDLHRSDADGAPDEPSVPQAWWRDLGDPSLDERLDALVVRAVEHNRDLRAAANRIGAAVAQAKIAGAALYPQANAQFDPQRARQVFVGIPIPGSGGVASNLNNQFGLSLNVSWEVDLWGRIRAQRAAAGADLAVSAAEFAAARESLAAQTVRTFFAAVEARLQKQLAERTMTSFRRTADQVRDRFERGTRPALDLRLALGNVASAEALAEQRTEQLERTRRQLELLLGNYPIGQVLDADATLPETLPSTPTGLPSELLTRRPDLIAAERRLAAADNRLTEAWRALLPRLSLTASGGTRTAKIDDILDRDFRVWNIASNLLQPLFEGGRLRAEIARNEALVRAEVATFEQAVLTAFTEVESAMVAERRTIERVRALRELTEQQTAALRLAEERYQRGLTDFLTVADSQRAALDAESRWLEARRAMLDVRIDLHLALGGAFTVPTEDDPEPTPSDELADAR
jgi:multidrug efflux system outer membrane protein